MLYINYEHLKKEVEKSGNVLIKLAKKQIIKLIEKQTVYNKDYFIAKGHWVDFYDIEKKHHKYQCNRCGKYSAAKAPYCLKCGAKMIDEEDI